MKAINTTHLSGQALHKHEAFVNTHQNIFSVRPFICLFDSEMTNKIYLRKPNNRTNDATFFTGLPSPMYRTFRLINEIIKTERDNGVDSSTANITLGINIFLSTEADKCCQQINARPVFYLHVSCTSFSSWTCEESTLKTFAHCHGQS